MKTILKFYFINKVSGIDFMVITNYGINFYSLNENIKEFKNKAINLQMTNIWFDVILKFQKVNEIMVTSNSKDGGLIHFIYIENLNNGKLKT